MDNKIISLAIVIAIGIILTGSVLAPVINDASDAKLIAYNEGVPYDAPKEGTHTISIVIDPELAILYDGQPCILPSYESSTIVYGKTGFVRFVRSTQSTTISIETPSSIHSANAPCTITLDGSSATLDGRTIPDVLAHIAPAGAYVLCENAKVTDQVEIIGGGNTYYTQGGAYSNLWGVFHGTAADELAFHPTAIVPADSTASIPPGVITKKAVSGNLFEIESIKWVATITYADSSTLENNLNYTYFLVPNAVEYDNPAYLGSAAGGILAAIPVLVVVSLLLVAVSAIRSRND